MKGLIDRLDRWLATNRPDYYALLQPGAVDAQLNALKAQFSLQLPTPFRQLYRWRDGQDPTTSEPLQGNRSFLTLDEIISTKEILDGMVDDFAEPRWWRCGWIPLLHNGGGSYLCVDVAAEDGGESGQLVAFWKSDPDRPIEFPSLETWLTDLLNSMEAGSLKLL